MKNGRIEIQKTLLNEKPRVNLVLDGPLGWTSSPQKNNYKLYNNKETFSEKQSINFRKIIKLYCIPNYILSPHLQEARMRPDGTSTSPEK